MRNRPIRIAIAAIAISGLLLVAFLRFGPSASNSNVKAASLYSQLTPLQKKSSPALRIMRLTLRARRVPKPALLPIILIMLTINVH